MLLPRPFSLFLSHVKRHAPSLQEACTLTDIRIATTLLWLLFRAAASYFILALAYFPLIVSAPPASRTGVVLPDRRKSASRKRMATFRMPYNAHRNHKLIKARLPQRFCLYPHVSVTHLAQPFPQNATASALSAAIVCWGSPYANVSHPHAKPKTHQLGR